MSDFLNNELLKDDGGDDVEAHEFLKDDGPRDFLKDDEGDDVEAHSLLGPKDEVLGSVMMRDEEGKGEIQKRGEVL